MCVFFSVKANPITFFVFKGKKYCGSRKSRYFFGLMVVMGYFSSSSFFSVVLREMVIAAIFFLICGSIFRNKCAVFAFVTVSRI